MAEAPAQAAYLHNGAAVSAQQFYAIACDPRRDVAVEACAGAGKTWMLVSRILRALLESPAGPQDTDAVAPNSILAITFTKRAAAEMRQRLQEWLQSFAGAAPNVLAQELRARGVPDAQLTPQRCQQLGALYQRLLQSGQQVQVRTFHSWFAALLRVAPLALLQRLELPLGYELLEDDSQAINLVWRRFYQALVDQPERREDFAQVVLACGRTQTEKALAAALDKRTEFSLADAAGVVEQSVQAFGSLHPQFASLDDPRQALQTPAAAQRWLAWARALARESNATPQKAAQQVLLAFSESDAAADGTDVLAQRLAILRKAFFVADEDRLSKHLQKFAAAQEAGIELAALCAAEAQHLAWLHQQRMLRLTRVLLQEYALLKHQRGWVDMQDVERSAQAVLSDPVLSGWVQERLDANLRHVLIDEFQDTNPLQWQALMSWLGSYAGARGRAPRVFLVGDPKQSIYRFRRAEPQVFMAAQAFIRDGLGGDLLACDHTRRNATRVIDAVNRTMLQTRVANAYEGFRPHTTQSSEVGLVCSMPPILRVPANAGEVPKVPGEAGTHWRDSLDTALEAPDDSLRAREAQQAALWIRQQVDGGVAAPQIMVLSRRRAGLLPMQQALRAVGVAAQIGEKTALADCCEVQDLVALFDVLVSPQHDLSLARVLKSPLFRVSDEALVALALRQRAAPTPWFEVLQQPWPHGHLLRGIGAILLRWQGWVRQLPPHDALQAIFSDADVLAEYARVVPAEARPSVLANLRALLAAALNLGGGRFASPYAMVRAFKAQGVLAPAALTPQAVRLLTIHGAKGLEADIVILLDTDTPERPTDTMGVLVDWPGELPRPRRFVFMVSESRPPGCAADLLAFEITQRKREELNALYVAMTRARHTLVASSSEAHKEATDSWWQLLGPVAAQRASVPLGFGPVANSQSESDFTLLELP
ncbi:MAG: UvrD-helicase domain-containing protein, partial [Rhodoferax sp.]|nr:UvrD-helicase domain-containing protein [Rhodoferax sp.]